MTSSRGLQVYGASSSHVTSVPHSHSSSTGASKACSEKAALAFVKQPDVHFKLTTFVLFSCFLPSDRSLTLPSTALHRRGYSVLTLYPVRRR
jgi:nucleoside-diphosphate-sugar epimerase